MQKEILKDIIQWDITSWSKALTYWEQEVQWNNIHTCLELGAGTGGLSLWLALKNKQVICSDILNAESNCSALHEKYNVTHKIKYETISAGSIPYKDHFDLVIFKSMLGVAGKNNNMDAIKKVMEQVHQCLKPGGVLLFAENLAATTLHGYLRKRYVPWGNSWHYMSLTEMKNLLQIFSSYDIKATGFTAAFGRTGTQRNIFAIADKLIFNHITPSNWRYVSYGIAIK